MMTQLARTAVVWGCALPLVLLALVATPDPAAARPKCTIVGTNRADMLRGTPGPDVICGRGGADLIRGRGGLDRIFGDGGDDRLYGGRGGDRIFGGPGRDRIFGGAGADLLFGGRGRDRCSDSRGTGSTGCEVAPRPVAVPTGPPAGLPTGTEQPIHTGPEDHEPPTVLSISLHGRYVDTSDGDSVVYLDVYAEDPSEVGKVTVEIEGPGGPWRHLELEPEPRYVALLEPGFDVPASTPPGSYRVVSVTIADRAGNSRTLSAQEVAAAGNWSELEVFEGPDHDPPELLDVSLSSPQVDTTLLPATETISIAARDPLSGLKSATAIVEAPDGDAKPLVLLVGPDETPPASGTIHEGTWLDLHQLAAGATLGYYEIRGIYLRDLAGNNHLYGPTELESLGFPVSFLNADGPDTTPPEILDFQLDPTPLQTAAGKYRLPTVIRVRDDVSGFGIWPRKALSQIEIDVEPGFPWTEFNFGRSGQELASGSRLDGVWEQELVLEGGAAPGTYLISGLEATDRAGNTVTMDNAEIAARGWPVSFVNEP